MKYFAFESCYGYNSIIRLGKLHQFHLETVKYILETNPDLIVLNHHFKVLSRRVKDFLLIQKIRKYFTPFHLYEIQLGIRTMRQTIEEIKQKNYKTSNGI